MLSLLAWHKVIISSGFYCSYNDILFENYQFVKSICVEISTPIVKFGQIPEWCQDEKIFCEFCIELKHDLPHTRTSSGHQRHLPVKWIITLFCLELDKWKRGSQDNRTIFNITCTLLIKRHDLRTWPQVDTAHLLSIVEVVIFWGPKFFNG